MTIDDIVENFPDEDILKADGLDGAVIGIASKDLSIREFFNVRSSKNEEDYTQPKAALSINNMDF